MTTDRQHVHPLALQCLDRDIYREDEWVNAGMPVLTERASRTLAAVEEYGFEMCIGYKDDGGTLLPYPECTKHGPCRIKTICRAWRVEKESP